MKKALIVVDYQYDFADAQGKLYVPGGEEIKSGIEKLIQEYKNNGYYVVFSGDFHPKNHISFQKWNEHCLVDSKGAKFYIDENLADLIIKKGTNVQWDSYSAFYVSQTINVESELDQWLKQRDVKQLEICGLALDVCVQTTYNDAIDKGYDCFINYDLSKKINN